MNREVIAALNPTRRRAGLTRRRQSTVTTLLRMMKQENWTLVQCGWGYCGLPGQPGYFIKTRNCGEALGAGDGPCVKGEGW